MHGLIEELQQYHSDKAGHLSALWNFVGSVDGAALNEADWRDLKQLFQPFHMRSESIHHHNEELILFELKTTEAPIHRRVAEISADHAAFDRIVGKLVKQIEAAEVSDAQISAELTRFMEIYDDHANGEENIFFPLADRFLSDKNWRRVARSWKSE